jgi:LDH2 family malate/lactate/ureidoglycolate dehydrogenase
MNNTGVTVQKAILMEAQGVKLLVVRIFEATGLSNDASTIVAEALVDADLSGQLSHGLMLVEMYVDRIKAGSVTLHESAEIISDNHATIVLDAGNALGHLTGDQAMALAVARAQTFGVGIVTVRNGFHFGVARRFALAATNANCIGVAMCNTRPLMPAPGGAERVVGNNPLAIALPTEGEIPIVLDMAMSEAAMGKIRMAANAGQEIPATWATDANGMPTTNAEEAINGMLLPAAGPKGFGLAFIIDLLCGALSGGSWGDKVQPLYCDFSKTYSSAHLFMAIDTEHFGDPAIFKHAVAMAAETIRTSAKAPGTNKLYTPGEPEWQRQQQSNGNLSVEPAIAKMLLRLSTELQIARDGLEREYQILEKVNTHAKA